MKFILECLESWMFGGAVPSLKSWMLTWESSCWLGSFIILQGKKKSILQFWSAATGKYTKQFPVFKGNLTRRGLKVFPHHTKTVTALAPLFRFYLIYIEFLSFKLILVCLTFKVVMYIDCDTSINTKNVMLINLC